MRSIMITGSVLLALTGCVSRDATLTNPETGQQAYCTHSGWGWAGAPMAASAHSRCLDTWKSQGFEVGVDLAPRVNDAIVPLAGDGAEWNVRLAKQQYRSGAINRVEYERIIAQLKAQYRVKVRQAKSEYKSGTISKAV